MSFRYIRHCLVTIAVAAVVPNAIHPTALHAAGDLTLRISLLSTPVLTSRSTAAPDSGLSEMSIPLGSPLYLRLELVNETDQPITVMPSVNPAFGLVRLFLVGPGGKTTKFTTVRWEVGDRFLAPEALQPGARVTHETYLYGRVPDSATGGLEYLFPTPGTYQLFARYTCPNPQVNVESNRVTVRVGAPIPRWEELKKAGIIPHVEGISGSEEESLKRREVLKGLLGPAPNKALTPWFGTAVTEEPQGSLRNAPNAQSAVEQTLNAFMTAWAAGDLPGCTRFLEPDFHYNAALDRAQFEPLLGEALAQLRAGGANPQISTQDVTMTARGDTVEATCRLIMGNDQAGTLGEQQVQLLFTRKANTWLISRWNRLEP